MIFRLEKVIPLPMSEVRTEDSDIWEADSFVFEEKESTLVEAASGKGKTSLLSILYGLRTDFKGSVYIDGKISTSFSLKDWARLRTKHISYIFQGLELFDELSALDNVLLKNNITGFKEKSKIIELADQLGIRPFLNKKCLFLSFGQKQRVAILRALCQPYEYLLADECFSHIDRENSKVALDIIRNECRKQEAGLILTSLGNGLEQLDQTIHI